MQAGAFGWAVNEGAGSLAAWCAFACGVMKARGALAAVGGMELASAIGESKGVRSVSVWFSDTIQIRAQLLCKDEPGAAEIVREINEAVSLGKSQIEMLKVNPAIQQFAGPATSVTINGVITQSVVDAIPKNSRFWSSDDVARPDADVDQDESNEP